jgi:Probable sensor domain DACNV
MNHSAFQINQGFLASVCERLHIMKTRYAQENSLTNLFVKSSHVFQDSLAKLIDATYWASQAIEEGHLVKFSVVIKEVETSSDNFCFETPIILNLKNLVKLGSALDGSFSDICVNQDENGSLKIWGLRIRTPNHLTTDLWIQVLGPGNLLILCYGRSIAALIGNQAVFVDPSSLLRTIIPKVASNKEDPAFDPIKLFRFNTLLYIAQAMRAHQRGGTLLVVPEGPSWEKSIGQPVIYTGGTGFFEPEFNAVQTPVKLTAREVFRLIQETATMKDANLLKVRTQLIDQCNRIGRLTAIDGALVMTFDRSIRCFGAKIQALDPQPGSTRAMVLQPVEGDQGRRTTFADLGGTRHSSAAQFAHDQPGAVAIVASQDGNVTFFTKDVENNELLVIQRAELSLMYEGISGIMWNLSQFIDEEERHQSAQAGTNNDTTSGTGGSGSSGATSTPGTQTGATGGSATSGSAASSTSTSGSSFDEIAKLEK